MPNVEIDPETELRYKVGTVEDGIYLATKFGLCSVDEIFNPDTSNYSSTAKKNKDRNIDPMHLEPGTVVVIPKLQPKMEPCTEKTKNSFKLTQPTRKFSTKIQTTGESKGNAAASPDIKYILCYENIKLPVATATGGEIKDIPLPGRVRQLKIQILNKSNAVARERYFWLGGTHPLDNAVDGGKRGVIDRLNNLGFDAGFSSTKDAGMTSHDEALLASAIRAYRKHKGLPDGDQIDQALIDALKSDTGETTST